MSVTKLQACGVVAAMFVFAVQGFAQEPVSPQNRIPQQIVINGQRVNGAYVTAPGGGMQSFTCSSPQQYVTPDGASQGWACFDQATGAWLLNALPPAAAAAPAPVPAPQQPVVIYQQPPAIVYQQPAVIYASPAYPVVVERVYSPSVVLGAAAIRAAGRIVSAAIVGPRYSRHSYYIRQGRHGRRR